MAVRARLLLLGTFLCCVLPPLVAQRTEREPRPLPTPPLQFSTRLETLAHQLIKNNNETDDYPPHARQLHTYYDFEARRARFDYAPVPHMPPKSFVRRL